MTDSDTTSAWAPPGDENIAAMSPSQAATRLTEIGAQEGFRTKLLSGDGAATRYFHQLAEKRSQTEVAEAIVAAVADPEMGLPRPGGANNRAGMSKRDEAVAVQWQLDDGLSIDCIAEHEVRSADGAPMASPSDFRILERLHASCLSNPRYLTNDPDAKLLRATWRNISGTSRPLPPMPTTGIAR